MTDSQNSEPPKMRIKPPRTAGLVNAWISVGIADAPVRSRDPTLFIPTLSNISPTTLKLIAINKATIGFIQGSRCHSEQREESGLRNGGGPDASLRSA